MLAASFTKLRVPLNILKNKSCVQAVLLVFSVNGTNETLPYVYMAVCRLNLFISINVETGTDSGTDLNYLRHRLPLAF